LTRFSFNWQNNLIAFGCIDGAVGILDLKKKEVLYKYFEHKTEIRDLSFSPDGNFLFSAEKIGRIVVWDLNSKKNF